MTNSLHRVTGFPYGCLAAAALIALAASGSRAFAGDEPSLNLPLDCVPGKTCWISKFMDLDPGPGVRDYTCHGRANDGHSGIDFAIRDLRAMEEGVAVVAAAPGTVIRERDGVPDVSVREAGSVLKMGECGNGVIIDHGHGWTTQYCHMHEGSIAVKIGDHVETGQKLGLVGISGSSEYPHMHLTVRHQNDLVDPFVGVEGRAPPECGLGKAPLWNQATLAALAYTPAAIYNYGFASTQPTPEDIRKGRYRSLDIPSSSDLLILWADIFGVEPGDVLHMRVIAPNGQVLVDHDTTMPMRKARWYEYVGKKRHGSDWPDGTYHGEISLTRSENGSSQSTAVEVDAHVSSVGRDAPPGK